MATADRVQILPGLPGIVAITLDTNWQQLPRVDNCISVFMRPRPGGTNKVYIATETGASSLRRLEMLASDTGITVDTDTPSRFWARTDTGAQTLEIVVDIGVK